MKKVLCSAFMLLALCGCNHTQKKQSFVTVENVNGPTLGYSRQSGVSILTENGQKFKDLNRNGKLDKYEDWRLSIDERAQDLASKMTIEQIAGLMLYSRHQLIPANPTGLGEGLYDGKPFAESNANVWDLTDTQKAFLEKDHLRHILIMHMKNPEAAARWNNEMQSFAEGLELGIPGNTSSDPRHAATSRAEFSAGSGNISLWPDGLGMAATFSPSLVKSFGRIAAREYRALGITTALSPQTDLGTEPRWFRIGMTFGESPSLATDMTRAYIDGFQTSSGNDEIKDGWGFMSVNTMVKHWPGGGTVEGGRDAHWAYGKYAVYPGDNFNQHLQPFVDGAFKLEGKTKMASAVMPYYTISFKQAPDGSNYANGFSKYIIKDLLREKYGFDGVVCTDWRITGDEGETPETFLGKPWGVEEKSIAERHYIALMAGVDQFGGNNVVEPLLEAYRIGVREHGETFMRKRMEESAIRLLRNIFRVGLFENPYVDPEESVLTVGNAEFKKAGYEAQLKSVVMLKNKRNILPFRERKTVYVPKVYIPKTKSFYGEWSTDSVAYPVDMNLVREYYDTTDNPDEADFALVFVSSPYKNNNGGGYDGGDRLAGGNGYLPISLQYGSYTATTAREHSMAAGDPVIDPEIKDRSYRGKTTIVSNTLDLSTILVAKEQMKEKPVIVVVNLTRPMVFNEFEDKVEGILIRFDIPAKATLDIISGKYEPSGLLPVQMPANMETVEKQYEDVPFDMECHKDSEGNVYDFGFGLNWSGIIKDARTEKYVLHKN